MTFFNNADWIGFLAENVVKKCVALNLAECSGCKDGMNSDLLHLHCQLSLLEKIQSHFEAARGEALHNLPLLYKQIEAKLPHSNDKNKDKAIYLSVGRLFLHTISAPALYYGRYINETNDDMINEILSVKRKRT